MPFEQISKNFKNSLPAYLKRKSKSEEEKKQAEQLKILKEIMEKKKI
jgi:hypothetical protein